MTKELLYTALATIAVLALGTLVLPLVIALGCKALLVMFTQPLVVLKYIGVFVLGYLTKKFIK